MNRFCIFLLLFSVARAQTIPIDGVAAIVNGRMITAGDVLESTQSARRDAQRRLAGPALSRELARIFDQGLQQLIENRLILEAFAEMQGQLPEGAVRERTDTILRERFNNNRSELLNALRAVGKSEREWEDELRDQVILQQMTGQFVTRRLNITPRMLREYFDANQETFLKPVELRIQAISLRPVPEAELPARREFLETLRDELIDGADLTETARRVSQGANAQSGGDMGWVNPSTLPEALREGLDGLEPGRISQPILTPTQHFLVKVLERRGGDPMTLPEVQSQIEQTLRKVQFERAYQEWIQTLRRRFPVVIPRPDENVIQRRS